MKKLQNCRTLYPAPKKSCEKSRTQQLCLRHVITHILGKAIQSSTLNSKVSYLHRRRQPAGAMKTLMPRTETFARP